MTATTTTQSPKLPGRRIRLTANKEQDILNNFRMDLAHSSEGKRPRLELALRAYKAYRAYTDAKKSIFFSDVYIPRLFSAIQTVVAAEYDSIFSSPPFVDFKSRKKEHDAKADYYAAAFDYHFEERNAKIPIIDMLLQRRLFGHAFAVFYWKEEEREVADWGDSHVVSVDYDPETGEPIARIDHGKTIVSKRIKTVDSPWFDPIHFLEAFPDWSQRPDTFQDSRYFIHMKMRPRHYAEARFKSGAWRHRDQAKILESKPNFDNEYIDGENYHSVRNWQRDMGLIHDVSEAALGGLDEVAEYYTQEGVFVILNRQWIVSPRKGHPMGRLPIASIPNHLDPGGGFWGLSDFELIEKLNANIQNMVNASATEAMMAAFPMMWASPTVNKTELKHRPGHVITTQQGKDAIGFFTRPTTGIEVAENQVASGSAQIDDALGTSEIVRGALPNREMSATAVAQSVNSSTRRVAMNVDILNSTFIKELGLWYRDMIRILQSEPVSAKLRGSGETIYINPEDLMDADLECVPVAGRNNTRELELKQAMEILNYISQLGIQSVDKEELARVIVRLRLPKFYAQVVRSPEQAMAAQQQQLMMQAQEAQMMAAADPSSMGAPPPNGATSENLEGDHSAQTRDQAEAMTV